MKRTRENSIQTISITRIIALWIVFVCLFSGSIFAQSDSSKRPFLPIVLSDTKQFFIDAGNFFSKPVHWHQDDWFKTGAIVGGTSAAFLVDNDVRTLMQRNQSSIADDLSEAGRIYGENYFGVGLSAGMYGFGLFTKNKEIRTTGFMVFEAVAFSAAITQSIKFLSGRSRPYMNAGNTEFSPFTFEEDHVSLPSGHSTAAFAISSVLAGKINNTYASIGLYSIATLTALSRVYTDVHWTSDILLGSAIGYVTGKSVLSLHDDGTTTSSLIITPYINGLYIEYTF